MVKFCLILACFCHFCVLFGTAAVDSNLELETKLFEKYNRKARPVKDFKTTVNVMVYLVIQHVEQVDEHEQTLTLHGRIGMSWNDEYLTWKPRDFNGTSSIRVKSWKIWRPDIALWNSAKPNTWMLNFNDPAYVSLDGKIWISAYFSFSVTCMFDFSAYPYDTQICPLVLGDWIYDLSKVNLSNTGYSNIWNTKAFVQLSWYGSPVKQHVAGWELLDTYRKHCYMTWDRCSETEPQDKTNYNWYWSVIEYGIRLKRHAPYFGVVAILPMVVTTLITLVTFWIDTQALVLVLLMINIIMQGIFGWDILHELPPGSGTIPRIVVLYGFNFGMTGVALLLHVILQYLAVIVPSETQIPLKLSTLVTRLSSSKPFSLRGLQFDPQRLINEEDDEYRHEVMSDGDQPENQEQVQEAESTKTQTFAEQLFFVRRCLFFLYLFMYFVTLLATLL